LLTDAIPSGVDFTGFTFAAASAGIAAGAGSVAFSFESFVAQGLRQN
jgi:hypothetical protein